jgi:hypothetical protein
MREALSETECSIMQDEGTGAALIAPQQSQQLPARTMDKGDVDTVPLAFLNIPSGNGQRYDAYVRVHPEP